MKGVVATIVPRKLSLTLLAICSLAPAIAQQSGEGLPLDLREKGEAAIQVFDRGNRTEGLQALIQVVVEAERTMGRNNPAIAQIHNTLSVMFQSERVFDRALLHADRALECAAGFGDPKNQRLLQAKLSRAVSLLNLGRREEAERLYREAAPLFREIRDAQGEADALTGLGGAMRDVGRYEEAERALLAALEIQKTHKAYQRIAKTLSTLGGLYGDIGDDERALLYQKQAIEVEREVSGPAHAYLIDRFTGAARSLRRLKRYDEALALLNEARKIVEATSAPGSPQFTLLQGFEANIAADVGDFEKAATLLSALHKSQEDRFGTAYEGRDLSLNNLGYLMALKGDFARAEAMLSESLRITEQSYGKDNASAANCAMNRSILAALRGNADEAVTWLNDANSRYEVVLNAVAMLGADSQKLAFLQQLSGKTHYAITLHQKMFPSHAGATRAALTTILSRKGRAADLTRRTPDASDPKLQRRAQLLGEIAGIAIGKTQLRSTVAAQRVWALQQELERIERELGQGSDAGTVGFARSTVSIEAVQKRLRANDVLIEYVIYQPTSPEVPKAKADDIPARCAAYLLFADGTVKSCDLGELKPIDAAIRALRAGLSQPESDRYRGPARELDKLISEPLRKMAGVKMRWRIAPDGLLNLVPFGALLDENGKFLIETRDISYLSSGRDLLRPADTVRPGNALLVASPDYDAKSPVATTGVFQAMKFTPLPGTLAEVKSLSAMMPEAKVVIGAAATEGQVKTHKNPKLLHIATHGFYVSNEPAFEGGRGLARVKQEPPSSETAPPTRLSIFAVQSPLTRSGLALAGANQLQAGNEDGILTALEVTGLDLHGTKMVVLSACETGIGEVVSGEGVFGLRRAFHLAGAESQVLSLWKVHDDATRQLMERFYSKMTKGNTRAASLRESQLELLRSKNYHHPAYWASFILSGESGAFISVASTK